jgi:hypothetical protein
MRAGAIIVQHALCDVARCLDSAPDGGRIQRLGLFSLQLQKVPTSVVASLPTWSLCRPHSVLWPIGLFYHYCPQGTSRFTVFRQSFDDGGRTVPFLICTFLMVSSRLLIQRPLYLRHTMRLHAATGASENKVLSRVFVGARSKQVSPKQRCIFS